MSWKIYNDGNLLVIVNQEGDFHTIKTNISSIWYSYDNMDSPILYSIYQRDPENELILNEPYTSFVDQDGNSFADDATFISYLDGILSTNNDASSGIISDTNSSTEALTAGSTFTGDWVDVTSYNSIVVSVKTDRNGSFRVQYSPDANNVDSTLTRYYRTTKIEAPHRFTNTRKYARVTFTNDSSSDQTFLRLQTTLGDRSDLNAPLDSTLSPDFDAIAVRPTDYTTEVALGRRQGASLWNKFGYNEDIDSATPEVIASFGGAFNQRLTNAEQLDIVSTSTNDTNSSGTGVRQLVIFGVGGTSASDRNEITDVVALNGTTTVNSNLLFWGVNRMTIFQSGTANSNVGTITATAGTSGNTMAQMPAGEGTTQQCIFYVPESYQFLATWLYTHAIKSSGGGSNPDVTFKAYVYSEVVGSQFEVYRDDIDLSIETSRDIKPPEPFVIGEKSVFWIEASTTSNNTSVRCRFSGKLIEDVDV